MKGLSSWRISKKKPSCTPYPSVAKPWKANRKPPKGWALALPRYIGNWKSIA